MTQGTNGTNGTRGTGGAQPGADGAGLEERVAALSLEQKVRLLTGADTWSLHAEPAVGLDRIVLSDGPSGVRGEIWDEREPSLNLPSATALSATWDPSLAYRYGAAMAREAKRKGVHVVLGPTINLHRSPLGGRHFEAYSEDPELTSAIGEAIVRGLQDHGVGACPKHYVANDFETDRFTASVTVPERALRELYLLPFERTVAAGAWTIMSAYNAVDGVTMTEHDLLTSPLCDEWGFDGLVISDWGAVRSTAAARARQDLAMPGPGGPWPDGLVDAVRSGDVLVEAIDEKVVRILRLAERVGALDSPTAGKAGDTAPDADADVDGVGLAREVAAVGSVLVRNEGLLLPLAAPSSVALIGQGVLVARTQGGGSATVVPEYTVSPLDGLRAALPDARVEHTVGAVVHDGIFPFELRTTAHPDSGEPGLRVRFLDADDVVLAEEHRRASELVWLGNAPTADVARIEIVTDWRPPTTGPVDLGVRAVGRSVVEVDGEVVLDVDQVLEGTDLGAALLDPPTATVQVDLSAERASRLRVVYDVGAVMGGVIGLAAITVGSRPATESADALIAEAVEAARQAEVAVVVVGTNARVESEGFDRTSLSLPGRQDDLVRAVAAVNPRTVVVVNSGSPVLLPWREDVAAVLLTWFGGQEYGHALADVLTGAAEPGGRLPTTWPATQEDVPVIDVTPVDGVVRYDEGIHIGYRAWQRAGRAPAYPFGFGLGYTTWSYDDVATQDAGDGAVLVRASVTNTGSRAGREVVQVYLARPGSTVDRPTRWLAGSAVVHAEAGASVRAEVLVPARAFQHWDEASRTWVEEPGDVQVLVARHADASDLLVQIRRP
ncbi:MAG: beta-glucosidase [Actinotalea sp.]|nr:beta-glucosidase [Actinotalea sp.]